MAKVKVKFVGLSHLVDNCKELEMDAKDIQSLIEELALRYSKFREDVIDKNTGWVSSNFLILLNNVVIRKNHNFNDGDVVSIIQAISGGL
jgi:molybdopterin converting factor small subunit